MSIFNDIDWKKNNERECMSNSEEIRDYVKRFSQGHWTFLGPGNDGPGNEEKWYGIYLYKPERKWNSVAAQMQQRFEETGHPIFTCVTALSRGILKRMKNKDSLHFTAETSNIELLFRNIHFARQLSINGAVPS